MNGRSRCGLLANIAACRGVKSFSAVIGRSICELQSRTGGDKIGLKGATKPNGGGDKIGLNANAEADRGGDKIGLNANAKADRGVTKLVLMRTSNPIGG